MGLVTTLTTLVLNALASVLLSWTTWMASRSREQPSADPFLALSTTLTVWAVSSLGTTVVSVPTARFLEPLFDVVQFGALLFLPIAWIAYALSYAGRGIMATRKRVMLLSGIVLPVVIGAIALVSDASRAVIGPILGLALGWTILYGLLLFLYALYASIYCSISVGVIPGCRAHK